jgi:TRAP-type C4-dicarboxylate transport system substrate-binding protein
VSVARSSARSFAALAMALLVGACTSSTSSPAAGTAGASTTATAAASSTPVTLRLSDDSPIDSPQAANDQLFADEVAKDSGGSVKVEIFPAAQLYSEDEILPALQRGEVDMGVVPAWSSVEPAVLILDIPFQFTTWDEFHAALDGPMGQVLKDAYASHGIKHLYFQDNTTIDLIGTNKHIVKVPADLAGLRMRTISEAFSQAITLWGAAPTEMSGADTYLAVQKGTVDGVISGVSFIERKWYEVTPYITEMPFSFRTNALQMSMDRWNTLDAAQQAAITQAAATAMAANRVETPKTNVDSYKQLADTLAKEFYVATPDEIAQWRTQDIVTKMHDWYLQQAPAYGQKILDALGNP